MRICYVGDIMGEMGVRATEQILPKLITDNLIDFVVAQAENVTNGRGISIIDYNHLRELGIHAFSGGNHSFDETEIVSRLNDPNQPIVRPANYPDGTPGLGFKYVDSNKGRVLVISLLGQVVGRSSNEITDNPLRIIDQILSGQRDEERAATIVNFHGDYSSEKVIIGHYLDGRVSAVIGDHWHVPSADAQVLPKGTAHITDVGMCGSLDSSLGVTFESVLPRWRDGRVTQNQLAKTGRQQFNAVIVDVNSNGLAESIEHIRKVW